MFAKKAAVVAFAGAFLALALPATAQNADTLVQRYADLAGSEQNAKALVSGLREGSEVKLNGGKTTVTFDPPTQKMGYGNIDNALALAEASLKAQGISNPTPEQLKASLTGVLQMRADGKGWGQIADSLGFKLGEVKRSEKAERVDRVDKPARPEKPERPEKPARPDKPERPGR